MKTTANTRPYRITLEALNGFLQKAPDTCELYLYTLACLVDNNDFDVKWNRRNDVNSFYEALEPDADYLRSVEESLHKYLEQYKNFVQVLECSTLDEDSPENGDVREIIGGYSILESTINELKRLLVEVEAGTFMTSFYPERFGMGQNIKLKLES